MSSETPSPSHLGRLLRDANEAWTREFRARQRAAGIESARTRFDPILRHLGEAPEPLLALVERSGLTRRGFTELVEELERLGAAERFDDPADPRVKHLRYTERGLDLYRRSRDIMFALEPELAERMGPDRLALLHETLQELIAVTRPSDQPASD